MNEDDHALLARRERALRDVDPPPAAVLTDAKASFTMRDLDGELAALVFDSALKREPVDIRGDGGSRLLSFEADDGGVEIEVIPDDGRLVGQVVPAASAEVEVVDVDGSRCVVTDHLGRFAVTRPATGPVQLRWRSGDRLTRTDWIVL